MTKAYWFNPENDMALAADSVAFTPTVAAALVHEAGALLPLWLAEGDDDLVIAPDGAVDRARELAARFGLKPSPISVSDCRSKRMPAGVAAAPWGWSRAARTSLAGFGVDRLQLPDDAFIAAHRLLSHRRTAIEINRMTGVEAQQPLEATTTDEAMAMIDSYGGDAVVKTPWSSSGRGVFYTSKMRPAQIRTTIEGAIRRQGSVVVERRLDVALNFASLYRSDGNGRISFEDFSLFFNDHDPSGAQGANYGGNIVAPQSVIAEAISQWVDPATLRSAVAGLTEALTAKISETLPAYDGWIGVDMLAYRTTGGQTALAPCIEVNLRSTMGVVALQIARRLAAAGDSRVRLFGMEKADAPEGTSAINLSPPSARERIFTLREVSGESEILELIV